MALRLFDRLFVGPSWAAWRALVCGLFGLPMSAAEAETFRQLTGRQTLPAEASVEAWTVVGRRGGKSRIAAFVVTFLAAVRTWQMAPGERPLVLLIAPSRRQAGVVLGYTEAMVSSLPGVSITRRTQDEIELSTGVTVLVASASFRTPRGFTVVGLVADEIAYWRNDAGANPDREILRAVRPALASVPGSLLMAISTPYAQRGMLYETHERHFGRDDSDILVVQAPTRALNPTIPERRIARALDEDPTSASAEWLAQFRADLESLFSREALAAVTVRGRYELAPAHGLAYVGFLDSAGGSGRDSMTLGIAHRDAAGRPVLDLVREVRPPFSPEDVVDQFSAELKRYGCGAVFSDAYAALWPVEQFAKRGITVQPSPFTRSQLYLELLPAVSSGGCELLDHLRLLAQLADLERRTGASGRDAVDHRRGQHDDVANGAAGALVMCTTAVGLKAPMPAAFTRCVNDRSSAPSQCALLLRGPLFPNDGHCHRECPGLRAVKPVYQQYRETAGRTGEVPMMPLAFIRERFEFNPFMERQDQARVERWAEGIGL